MKANAGNLARCAPCQPGSWSAAELATCTPCEAGKMSAREGETACEACPAGRYSAAGWASCEACGEHGDEGMNCSGGLLQGVRTGYWTWRPIHYSNANDTTSWPCPTRAACLGGFAWPACASGHEGVLCASCAAGHIEGDGELCRVDDSTSVTVFFLLGALLLVLSTCVCAGLGVWLCWRRTRRVQPHKVLPPWEEGLPSDSSDETASRLELMRETPKITARGQELFLSVLSNESVLLSSLSSLGT